MARKRCIEGEVLVRFELLENGDIENIRVIDAVNDILARAAVTTIERLEGKFPLPSERLVLNVPIMYVLN
jgi:TonB family protein